MNLKTPATKKRLLWLDNIRTIACLLVVLLHVSAGYLYEFNEISDSAWQVGNIVDSFTRVCVPLFFMISGYIFFREKKPNLNNYLKLCSAILFYSFIYIVYMKLGNIVFNTNFSGFKELFITMLHGPIFYHLWFFYALLIVYLFSNLITIRNNIPLTTFVLLFLVLVIWLNPIEFPSSYMKDTLYYILLGISGAYIGQKSIPDKYKKMTIVVTSIIVISSTIFIANKTSEETFQAQEFTATYYSYISIPVIFSAVSIFIFWMNVTLPNSIQKISSFIAKYSLGIYGIHALFLSAIGAIKLRNFNLPIIDIPLTFIITMILSIIFAIIVRKFDKKGFIS